LNLAFFIAKRLRQSSRNQFGVAPRIIKIATTAVAMGMAMILIALATGTGLQQAIRDKTAAFNGHLTVAPFENNASKVSLTPLFLDTEMLSSVRDLEGVSQLQGVAYIGGMLKNETTFEGIVFKGVDSEYDWTRLEDFRIAGSFAEVKENAIVISETLAQRLQLKIGDGIRAYFQNSINQKIPSSRNFQVVAIYNSGFPDIDNTHIIGALDQVRSLKKWSPKSVGNYEVFLEDFETQESMGDQIYDMLPAEVDVVSLGEKYQSIFQWIALFDYNILIILIVMIIVGVINMATALLVLIFERSRMIGLLKTMGATDHFLQTLFLSNGGLILIKGLVWGNAIGLVFYVSQKYGKWITLDPTTYYVKVAPVALDVLLVLGLNFFVLLTSLLCLWIPLWVVSKIEPHRVIRFR